MITPEEEAVLRQIYYTEAYQRGIHSVFRLAKERLPTIQRDTVSSWLKKQEVYQIDLQQHHTKHIKPILTSRPLQLLQIDLVDFSQKPSNNYRYIMNVIDVFSKYLWSVSTRTKSSMHCKQAIQSILDKIASMNLGNVRLVMTDNGGEFASFFNQFLVSRNIKHIRSPGGLPQTQGVVERVNRTQKSLLLRRTKQLGGGWDTHIAVVADQYNNTFHNTTREKPIDILFNQTNIDWKRTATSVQARQKKIAKENFVAIPKSTLGSLSVGDRVRLKIRKGKNDNYYRDNWSEAIYIISKIRKGKQIFDLPRYGIENSNGLSVPPMRLREDLQKIS